MGSSITDIRVLEFGDCYYSDIWNVQNMTQNKGRKPRKVLLKRNWILVNHIYYWDLIRVFFLLGSFFVCVHELAKKEILVVPRLFIEVIQVRSRLAVTTIPSTARWRDGCLEPGTQPAHVLFATQIRDIE